jgi:hypothetical protein
LAVQSGAAAIGWGGIIRGMEIEPPAWWEMTLVGGQILEVWADAYHEAEGWYEFNVLADAAESEQKELEITGRTLNNPQRVIVTVARVPQEIVASIRGGGSGKAAWLNGHDDL